MLDSARRSEQRESAITVTNHGRTGLSHLLAGSVAEAVMRKAPCPVVTVKKANP